MSKWPVLTLIFLFLFSCGKSTDQKIQDAILDANIELSRGGCQEAIDVLETLGRQNKNAQYLKTLASAYACRAGYSTVTFFVDDFPKTATPAPMGGTTTFTLSKKTFQSPLENDPVFLDIQRAIDILLYAGGIASTTEPTASERAKYFTTAELADLNTQLMYLQLTQLGIILKVYGNASATGVKNSGVNYCFSDYPSVNGSVQALITANAGAGNHCPNHTQTGNSQINSSVATATRLRRMCYGVVAYNGFFDSLAAVIASATGNISNIGAAAQAASTAAQTLLTGAVPAIGIVKSTLNQSKCENTSNVPAADIESFYAVIMESMLI